MRLDEKLTAGAGVYFDGTLVDSLKTPFQLIEVFDTPDLGKLMRIDGANMVSERDEFFYHENLIHPVAIAHPAPRSVLIIGGGDGGSLEEVLKYREIARVVLAELDSGVIEMAKKHFASVHRHVFDDPRVEVRIGDGMALVRESGERFDLIYLDLTDPIGPAEALYTQTFYADCKRALNSGRRAGAAYRLAVVTCRAGEKQHRQSARRICTCRTVVRTYPDVRRHLGIRFCFGSTRSA